MNRFPAEHPIWRIAESLAFGVALLPIYWMTCNSFGGDELGDLGSASAVYFIGNELKKRFGRSDQ